VRDNDNSRGSQFCSKCLESFGIPRGHRPARHETLLNQDGCDAARGAEGDFPGNVQSGTQFFKKLLRVRHGQTDHDIEVAVYQASVFENLLISLSTHITTREGKEVLNSLNIC
jgi:hypothetical protein